MIQVCPVPFPAHTLSGAEGRAPHSRRSCTDLRSAPSASSSEPPERPHEGFRRRRLSAISERVSRRRARVCATTSREEVICLVGAIVLGGIAVAHRACRAWYGQA